VAATRRRRGAAARGRTTLLAHIRIGVHIGVGSVFFCVVIFVDAVAMLTLVIVIVLNTMVVVVVVVIAVAVVIVIVMKDEVQSGGAFHQVYI
jgi:hypothetical protein